MANYKKIGFKPADVLIPQNIDMTLWSVVACDQYTSQPEYWQKVEALVGDKPSAFNVIFPEIYLEGDNSKRIEKINKTMEAYIENGIFKEYKNSMIYVERTIGGGRVRHGIVGAVDLEAYDYSADSKSLIRATEGTVVERIPPRVCIRKDAAMELPHIMILIDDKDEQIIEAVDKSKLEKLYDFDLMLDSGHIEGYLLKDTESVCSGFEKLMDVQGENPLLFAMGDGNHSLATAKTCWENIKKDLTPQEKENHPARFALAEIVNIHDSSMVFEPIHRVLFDVDADKLIDEFLMAEPSATFEKAEGQQIDVVLNGETKKMYIPNPSHTLAVGTLQKFLDKYISQNGGKIDYIHGDNVTVSLTKAPKTIGFILPAMDKSELFTAIKKDGALPRKTFSIGEAFEKRFYLEGRKIK